MPDPDPIRAARLYAGLGAASAAEEVVEQTSATRRLVVLATALAFLLAGPLFSAHSAIAGAANDGATAPAPAPTGAADDDDDPEEGTGTGTDDTTPTAGTTDTGSTRGATRTAR